MRSVWQSLVWKEWHEHKWKLASISVVLLGVTALAMANDDLDRFGAAYGMLLMSMVPLSIFVGLGTAASERSRSTLPFLQSLPVPMWQVAVTKLVAGLATVTVPIIVAVVAFFLWLLAFGYFGVRVRGPLVANMSPVLFGNWFLDVFVVCAAIAGSLFLWSAAAGVNRKDEISAGARALSIIIGWSTFLGFFVWTFGDDPVTPMFSWLPTIGLSLAPGGGALLLGGPALEMTQAKFALAAWITAAVHAALVAIYLQRFGRITEREIVSPRHAKRNELRFDWLAPPRRSPLTAIVWKQFRESGPVALVGLAGMVAIVLLMTVLQGSNARPFDTYFAVAASLGSGIALVIGIGVVLHDMGPRLLTFWRSRPIDPDAWFWVKFVTGLIVMFSSLYAPLPVIAAVSQTARPHPDALVLPALHAAAFAAAVAMTCLVRHAVYAAIFSIALLYASVAATWGLLVAAARVGRLPIPSEGLSDMTEAQVALGLISCFAASTVVAWLAVRNDWGWKSRY